MKLLSSFVLWQGFMFLIVAGISGNWYWPEVVEGWYWVSKVYVMSFWGIMSLFPVFYYGDME